MTIARSIKKLDNHKKSVYHRAHDALIKYGKNAVPLLLTAFDSPNPRVRYRVAMILGAIGDSRALEPLIAHATGDPEDSVRYDSAIGLGKLGDVAAVPFLVDLCLHPIDETCTDSAAWASLARIGNKSLPFLQAKMADENTPEELGKLQEIEESILYPDR